MLVLFSLVEHLKFGIDHKVSTILLLMSLMTSGEGRFFFSSFSEGVFISSSYSHFLSKIPSSSDSKFRKKCVFLAYLNVN